MLTLHAAPGFVGESLCYFAGIVEVDDETSLHVASHYRGEAATDLVASQINRWVELDISSTR